jgi:GH24 family phage-related lysozyme (muramidase)
MTDWQPTKLRDFFFHYDFANPDHVKAADLLQAAAPALMTDDAEWVKTYRGAYASDDYLTIATNFIAPFEGFRSSPYVCPAGVWTIGYGTTYYPDGYPVQPGDPPITEAKGKELLEYTISHSIVPVMETTIPTWGPMNDNQRAAIISFAYNLGAHFYGGDNFNTITRALSTTANWPNVPSALMLYVNPGSSFEAGLRRRREAEGNLWMRTT